MIRKKRFFVIMSTIIGLVILVLFLLHHFQTTALRKIDFLELQINPTKSMSVAEEATIKAQINKYLINDSSGCYFSELRLSLTDNPYSVYYLFYNYLMLVELRESTDLIDSNISYIVTALTDAVENEDVSAMDVVAGICLQKMVTGEYDSSLMEYFDENYFDDEKKLYVEAETDTISSEDIAFTSDVCQMFNIANIEYDNAIKDAVESYFDSVQFVQANDTTTIYSAGGDALYAMIVVGNTINITQELKEWYLTWLDFYPSTITSWEDILTIECIYKPVADALGETVPYLPIEKFVGNYENIAILISEEYEERVAYDLLKNNLSKLSVEGQNLVLEKVQSCINDRVDALKRISMRSSFYGIQLCYIISYDECDYEQLMRSIVNYYSYITELYESDNGSVMLEQVINDTYYYLMIDHQRNEGEYSLEAITLVNSLFQNITADQIADIKDPCTLRQMCVILSQIDKTLSSKEKSSIRELYTLFVQNEDVVSSYYIVDLYIIEKIMDFNELTSEQVTANIDAIRTDGCYRNSNFDGGIVTLEATFNIYALIAYNDELGTIYTHSQTMSRMITNDFRRDDGTYSPYKETGASKLYTLYWGLCLTNI